MTYVLLALAAVVYLWPAGNLTAPNRSTGYQAALMALSAVRSQLVRTQAFSAPCQEAIRTLTLALVEGADR